MTTSSSPTPLFDAQVQKAKENWRHTLQCKTIVGSFALTGIVLAFQQDLIHIGGELPEFYIGIVPNSAMALAAILLGPYLLDTESKWLAQGSSFFASMSTQATASLLGGGIAYFTTAFAFADDLGVTDPLSQALPVCSTMIALAFFHVYYCLIAWFIRLAAEYPEVYKEWLQANPKMEGFRLFCALFLIELTPIAFYMELHR